MEEGVSQVLRGGDGGLGALNGTVDGVQHGGDGALLWQGWEEDGEGRCILPRDSLDGGTPRPSLQ